MNLEKRHMKVLFWLILQKALAKSSNSTQEENKLCKTQKQKQAKNFFN